MTEGQGEKCKRKTIAVCPVLRLLCGQAGTSLAHCSARHSSADLLSIQPYLTHLLGPTLSLMTPMIPWYQSRPVQTNPDLSLCGAIHSSLRWAPVVVLEMVMVELLAQADNPRLTST